MMVSTGYAFIVDDRMFESTRSILDRILISGEIPDEVCVVSKLLASELVEAGLCRTVSTPDVNVLDVFTNGDMCLADIQLSDGSIHTVSETVFDDTPFELADPKIPSRYLDMDIEQECNRIIASRGLDERYSERVRHELEIGGKEYEMKVKCAKYVVDILEKNKIVVGVGRGSSCSSLCMYLLDVHMIDPILHDIEFE